MQTSSTEGWKTLAVCSKIADLRHYRPENVGGLLKNCRPPAPQPEYTPSGCYRSSAAAGSGPEGPPRARLLRGWSRGIKEQKGTSEIRDVQRTHIRQIARIAGPSYSETAIFLDHLCTVSLQKCTRWFIFSITWHGFPAKVHQVVHFQHHLARFPCKSAPGGTLSASPGAI